MARIIEAIQTRNYRCLADLRLDLGGVNIFFGPNGSGKSTLLDALWFVRDCAVRGVDEASGARSHGIGLLWDGAEAGATIALTLETDALSYRLTLGMSSGRIEPFAGEHLQIKGAEHIALERAPGEDRVRLVDTSGADRMLQRLREPDRLSLKRLLDFDPNQEAVTRLDQALLVLKSHQARSFGIYPLRHRGSEIGRETWLWPDGKNLWSALQNLRTWQAVDPRYDTILRYMRRAFPGFQDLVLEVTGPGSVYGSFLEAGRSRPILATGVSDGHLQLLLLLTALFGQDQGREVILLLDEPETGLHPWPLAVLAEAIREAADGWGRQVLVATHSPVLLSQFSVADCYATESREGRTHVQRLSDMPGLADLLTQYAAGSLYMAEMVAPQSLSAVAAARSGAG